MLALRNFLLLLLGLFVLTAETFAAPERDRFRNFAFYLPASAKLRTPSKEEKRNGLTGWAKIRVSLGKLHEGRAEASAFGIPLSMTRDLNRRNSPAGSYIKETQDSTIRVSVGKVRPYPGSKKVGEYRIVSVTNKRTGVSGTTGSFSTGESTLFISGSGRETPATLRIERWVTGKVRTPECESTSQAFTLSENLPTKEKFTFINPGSLEEIIVLPAYTYDVGLKFQTPEAIQAHIVAKISELNAVFENSKILTYISTGSCPFHALAAGGPGGSGATEAALENGDGVWDELHELRAQCKADLVHVFQNGTSGMALIPAQILSTDSVGNFARFGFGSSVVGSQYSVGMSHFPHEIGHNFGAGHDVATLPSPDFDPTKLGFHPYSHGHRFVGDDGKTYYTTMTYNKSGEFYSKKFSDPNILHQGVPTGTEDAKNANTIRFLSYLVSQYGDNLIYPEGISLTVELEKSFDSPQLSLITKIAGDLSQPILKREDLSIWALTSPTKAGEMNRYKLLELALDSPISTPLQFPGTYFASLRPDRQFQSETITTPNLHQAVLSISAQGTSVSGIISPPTGTLPTIKGNWVGVYYAPAVIGAEFQLMQTIGVNAGAFSFSANQPGYYRVGINTSTGLRNSNIILVN